MLGIINNDSQKNIRSKSARPAEKFNNFPHLPGRDAGRFNRSSTGSQHDRRLFGNRILAAVGDCDFERMMPHFESVSLAAGRELYAACEINDYIYFPETAVVSHLCILADGKCLEIAMVGSEGATGLCAILGSPPPMHQAVVAIEGKAWRIKTEILRQEFVRAGKFQMLLIDYVNKHLAEISQRVVCESFHLLEKRLCRWLLTLHDRVTENQFTLTHDQISQFLGVNRPTLTKAAKTLRDEGLINYVRGKFYILDRQRLEAAACECYSAVRGDF